MNFSLIIVLSASEIRAVGDLYNLSKAFPFQYWKGGRAVRTKFITFSIPFKPESISDHYTHTRIHKDHSHLIMAFLSFLASSQLLDVKEFLNEPDVDQDCALHLAAESRNVKSVELCLKYGANVNAQRSSLMTPLHIASMRGDLEIVKILCGKGADIHIKDNEKKTSLHR